MIRSFFKYLVCNVNNSVFDRDNYHKFFKYSLKFFTTRFQAYKNFFKNVHAILRNKQKKLETEQTNFKINWPNFT